MKLINFALILFSIALVQAKLVMIIRHGEKINDDYTDLSPKGKARAHCLVNVFGNNGTYATPQRIYAQNPTEKKQSTRPKDTVEPLAESLGLQVDLSYTSGQIKKLTSAIMSSADEVTLISWNNDKIPEIAEKFGITNPPDWKSKVFDDIWMIYDSATTSYLKNSLTKRNVYPGTSGYTMEIVEQNINDCIAANAKNFQSSSSDATRLTSGLIMAIVSLIICIIINF
ncbi:hypothetical protein H8356DRAFT_1617520 [Neocallimastix lanati (nom. inval.)]|jgi:broad specificity phosphatase PhoE|uniref:Phosphoglycerate mutase-like protein n=1 Tax=Neocallimastix californiae TaxID=1754190 RepID=A0A1Y2FUY3_9FUNG|nr:hypothetical protein H8356DRAFT_1617520 [Neocallimastix sp. JGI-2020a]ORY86505.1 hypothetical protein LY90DRAFT_696811 [Neocallimastix californiae]|eukprot:ORY86505.1 hypothetical protein LY90DRAFT_696811 [Neocallimastix californiae]